MTTIGMSGRVEPHRVLHVVSGLSAQGGVMSFAETVASAEVGVVDARVWKHRDFQGRSGVAWEPSGVARATDLGMAHDLTWGIREGAVLRRWLRARRQSGERWMLHAHSRVGALAAALAGRAAKCPVAIHLHKLSGQPWIYRGLVKWCGARWVFNSQRTRRHHGVGDEGLVIYPPIAWPTGPALGAEVSAVGSGRWIACGAFVRVKQFDRLIRAVSILRLEGNQTPLEIIGRSCPPVDPAHDRELEALAERVPGVTLRGYAKDWSETLRPDDVFVHVADREAYGIVVLEAFALGCRVVVPPLSLLDEIPGDWRGAGGVVVAKSTGPDALADAIRSASAESGDAASRWQGRLPVGRVVSLEECVCQLRGLYRSLPGNY